MSNREAAAYASRVDTKDKNVKNAPYRSNKWKKDSQYPGSLLSADSPLNLEIFPRNMV
jgi:hypothetical protein